MKKSVIALLTAATLSSSAFAETETVNKATANFQWGGAIPAAEITDPDVCIDDTGAVDHMNGVLEFSNDGKEIALVDASELSFKVMNNSCDAGTAVDQAYKYSLKSTQVSIGGLAALDHEWLYVEDENGALQAATATSPVTKTAGSVTTLTVKADNTIVDTDAEDDQYDSLDGQDVLVLAVLEVTNEI